MLIAFLIMLREGLEAALVVGIVAGYLVQSGRRESLPALWAGLVAALAACVVAGGLILLAGAEFPQREQELFEGAVALVAVGMLVSMVFWMKRAGRSIKAELRGAVDKALVGAADGRGWARLAPLALLAFLIVGREGLESVVFLAATLQQDVGWSVPVGAALGLAGAAALGALVFQGGARLDLRRFFRLTGAFVILVAGGLLAGALRSFHEAGLWNGLQGVAFDLSPILPADGVPGTLLAGMLGYRDAPTWGEVALYLAFVIPALALFLAPSRSSAGTLGRVSIASRA
jgi:high-affinity iron transporter